jgi:DNA-binding PadR family transcriptional regulator
LADTIALTETTYYILLSLYRPLHGYGIMQRAAELSDGRVRLAAGTLYGALNALVEKGWITLLPGEGRKKEYRLTPMGLEILKKELARLRELVASGDLVLKEEA